MSEDVNLPQLNTNGMKRPFPGLTAAQRWHVEVYGYVVIENVINADEVGLMLDAMRKLKRDFDAKEDPWSKERAQNCMMYGAGSHVGIHHHFEKLLKADPIFLKYATHPRIVGMAQELVGNAVRVSETQAAINSPEPGETCDGPGRYGWHRDEPMIVQKWKLLG